MYQEPSRVIGRELPLYDGEQLHESEDYSGRSWQVPPSEHVGHTLTVLGQVEREDYGLAGLMVVRCSCGETYRMPKLAVDKALARREGALANA